MDSNVRSTFCYWTHFLLSTFDIEARPVKTKMSSSISRYLVRESVPVFLLSLLGLAGLILLTQSVRIAAFIEPTWSGLHNLTGLLGWASLPVLHWLLFPAWVIAFLATAGRMSRDNELLAMSAAGRGPASLLAWPLILTLALAGISLGLSLWVTPLAYGRIESKTVDIAVEGTWQELASGRGAARLCPEVWIEARETSRGDLKDLVLIDRRKGSEPAEIHAKSGRIARDGAGLSLHLSGGEVSRLENGAYTSAVFEEADWTIPMSWLEQGRWALFPDWIKMNLESLSSRAAREGGVYRKALHRRLAEPVAGLGCALLAFSLFILGPIRRRAIGLVWAGAIVLVVHVLSRLGESLTSENIMGSWLAALVSLGAAALLGLYFLVRRLIFYCRLRMNAVNSVH